MFLLFLSRGLCSSRSSGYSQDRARTCSGGSDDIYSSSRTPTKMQPPKITITDPTQTDKPDTDYPISKPSSQDSPTSKADPTKRTVRANSASRIYFPQIIDDLIQTDVYAPSYEGFLYPIHISKPSIPKFHLNGIPIKKNKWIRMANSGISQQIILPISEISSLIEPLYNPITGMLVGSTFGDSSIYSDPIDIAPAPMPISHIDEFISQQGIPVKKNKWIKMSNSGISQQIQSLSTKITSLSAALTSYNPLSISLEKPVDIISTGSSPLGPAFSITSPVDIKDDIKYFIKDGIKDGIKGSLTPVIKKAYDQLSTSVLKPLSISSMSLSQLVNPIKTNKNGKKDGRTSGLSFKIGYVPEPGSAPPVSLPDDHSPDDGRKPISMPQLHKNIQIKTNKNGQDDYRSGSSAPVPIIPVSRSGRPLQEHEQLSQDSSSPYIPRAQIVQNWR